MFLYQLVNLVLKTCFFFSKTLKLSKTFLSLVLLSYLDHSFNERYDSPIPDCFRNSFQECYFLSIWGVFTKSIVVSILDFWHIFFRKMFKLLTCKRNHNFWVSGVKWRTLLLKRIRDMASLWDVIRHFSRWGFLRCFCNYQVGRHVLINLKLIDMAFGFDVRWFIIESPVGRHVLNVFYLKDFGNMVLVSGQNEVLYCYCLFFDVKKQCLFQEQ